MAVIMIFETLLVAAFLGKISALQSNRQGLLEQRLWPGLSAPLDQTGYQYIVASQDTGQLWRFLRRVIVDHGATIQSEPAFHTFIAKCLGRTSSHAFSDLLEELSSADWISGFQRESVPQTRESSQKPTVNFFVAGLEGSGHSLLRNYIDACFDAGGCKVDPELTRTLWDSRDDKASLKEAWIAAAARDNEGENSIRKVRLLNAYELTDHVGELAYTGAMAYPSFTGDVVPRLDMYNAVAKEVGDHFFALVLLRDPRELLCSDVVKLGHSGADELIALTALVNQLQTLEPYQFLCLDYDMLPVVSPQVELFLGSLLPTGSEKISASARIAQTFQRSISSCPHSISTDLLEGFEIALEPLYRLCRGADQAAGVAPLPLVKANNTLEVAPAYLVDSGLLSNVAGFRPVPTLWK